MAPFMDSPLQLLVPSSLKYKEIIFILGNLTSQNPNGSALAARGPTPRTTVTWLLTVSKGGLQLMWCLTRFYQLNKCRCRCRWLRWLSGKDCFNCLGNHKPSTCTSSYRCHKCKGKHHTSLCSGEHSPRGTATAPTAPTVPSNIPQDTSEQHYLFTLPLHLSQTPHLQPVSWSVVVKFQYWKQPYQ